MVSFSLLSCGEKALHLAVLTPDPENISSALNSLSDAVPFKYDVDFISGDECSRFEEYDLIWVHGNADEYILCGADSALADYASAGGMLVLSMDAVRLLNSSGMEAVAVSSWKTVPSETLGLLRYYSHPVFFDFPYETVLCTSQEPLSWECYGFSGSELPSAEGAQVIATLLCDGKNQTERKVMWEMPYGSGKVLAVGAGVSYGSISAKKKDLRRFTANILGYMSGNEELSVVPMYWDFSSPRVAPVHEGHHINCRICASEYKPVRPPRPELFDYPKNKDTHAAGDGIVNIVCDGMSLVAEERGGFDELWIDDVRIAFGYRPLIDIKGCSQIMALPDSSSVISFHENGFTRTYSIDGVSLSECVTLCPDRSSLLIHYEWESDRVRQLFTECRTDLAFGAPYDMETSCMSLFYVWSLELNATVVRDSHKNFASILGTNVPGRMIECGQVDDITYYDWKVRSRPVETHQVASTVLYDVRGLQSMDVVLSGTASGIDGLLMDYAYVLRHPQEVAASSWK